MDSKKIIGILVVVAVVLGGFVFIDKSKDSYKTESVNVIENTTGIIATTTPTIDVVTTNKTYSMLDVSSHNSSSDCWATISGKVYNLTSWIGQHPGGSEKILSICGKDGTSSFDGQHGGQKRPAGELSGFYIGDLK